MTPEKIVQNAIVNFLNKQQKQEHQPVFVERRNAGGFSYKKGIPDLYAVINGIHLEIEVKAPGGSMSTMQEKFRDKCKRLGINWCCVDDINDFIWNIYNPLMHSEIVRKA